MYAIFSAFDEKFEHGIYHRRRNGEIVRELTREDADFVENFEPIKIGTFELKGVDYYYVIEFEEGDVITSTCFGKEDTSYLKEASLKGLWPRYIGKFFASFAEQGKKANEKYENFLREILPIVFCEDNELFRCDEFLYLIKFLDYVNYTGKSLEDFVDRCQIEQHMANMIQSYRLTVVEKYLKQENAQVSKNISDDFEKAKLQLKNIKELAIQKVKNGEVRNYSRQDGLYDCFTLDYLDARVSIDFFNEKFWVILEIRNEVPWFTQFITQYYITEECEGFESLYEKCKKMFR